MTTLAQAQAKLAEYQAAETRILEAQEVRAQSGGVDRWEKQTELALVQKGIAQWQRTVDNLTAQAAGVGNFAGLSYSRANFGNPSSRF
jgi:hypothetical protein